ncbi:hypothetical protein BV22DRAFT_1131055 [Leucogyrophana mollusca]|uniref:Uncharacterized protein n=1 Tax=Leucogyrophana mollusca TaxID=85980 RepID=A0ACB8BDY4_9AGAM|nr:hypothetical protein BV22DRAFT_1131055 [Leucogyrophana mollusca]
MEMGYRAARLSLTFSVIRVADHRPKFQRFALGVAGLFGLMWIGLLGQKIYICYLQGCVVKSPLAISQLTTDVVSDTILVIMPFLLLRGVRISSNRYTLICCAFFASISITVITIFHSILLFRPVTAWTGTVAHVKTAVSLIVCNLLVIVTFAYRVCCKLGGVDLDHSFVGSEPIIFTSIDLNELTIGTNGEGGEGSPEVPPFQHEADDMVADKLVATTVSDVESSGGRGEAFDVGSGSIS